MGVCYLQHRCVTGVYNNKVLSSKGGQRMREGELSEAWRQKLRDISYSVILVLYAFLIISLLTVARKITKMIETNDMNI